MSKDVTQRPDWSLSPADPGCGYRTRFEMPETVVHFQIRMPPSLHEQLASRAREDKSSLNALVVTVLRDAVERREAAGAAPIPAAIPSR
jgi:hypothetical protein